MFFLTLDQMIMMLLLIVAGYILKRKNILPEKSSITISKLETFLFVPALSLFNQLENCTPETFAQNSGLMLFGLGITLTAILIAYPMSLLFVKKSQNTELQYQRNIYEYAITFGNYGFVGNFIILGIWGEKMFYSYTMYSFLIGVVCSVWGIYVLIPKEANASLAQNLKKGLLTPPIISLFVGIILGLLNVRPYVPNCVMTALENASKCMGPCAMILAGVVIGEYDIKSLVTNKKIYFLSFLRLLVIPSVFILILKYFGVSKEILIFTLVAFAAPIGLNTIVYPSAYGGDTKTGASMTVVSQALSVITIPVLYYLLIELI